MSIINRVKQHISDNRGKYGAAAGAGAMYGASKIDSPLLNQAGFNVLAKGQNLALDVADKIDPRATVALNDLGMHKIRQEDIDASNALYNSGVAKFINPNPVDMVNANEHSTEAYNRAMAAKASVQDTLINAKNQGQDYIDQGINYVKGLNPFTENTISIPIKNMLLEGYQPEEITEGILAKTIGGAALAAGLSLPYTGLIKDSNIARNVNPVTVDQVNYALKKYPINSKELDQALPNVNINGDNSIFKNSLKEKYIKSGGAELPENRVLHSAGRQSINNIQTGALKAGVLGGLGGLLIGAAGGKRKLVGKIGRGMRKTGYHIEKFVQ